MKLIRPVKTETQEGNTQAGSGNFYLRNRLKCENIKHRSVPSRLICVGSAAAGLLVRAAVLFLNISLMKSDASNQLTSVALIPGSPLRRPQPLCDMLIVTQTSGRMIMMCKSGGGGAQQLCYH